MLITLVCSVFFDSFAAQACCGLVNECSQGANVQRMLLCSVAEISAAALQEMNPLVRVTVQAGSTDVEDLSFVASYQVIKSISAASR